ncbi:MAG TPA: hypothetical protein VIW24_00830 [Aldersonia sp.]
MFELRASYQWWPSRAYFKALCAVNFLLGVVVMLGWFLATYALLVVTGAFPFRYGEAFVGHVLWLDRALFALSAFAFAMTVNGVQALVTL